MCWAPLCMSPRLAPTARWYAYLLQASSLSYCFISLLERRL